MMYATGKEVYMRIVRLLLQCGADPNLPAAKKDSWSIYRWCVEFDEEKLVPLLEEFGGTARFIILYCFPEFKYTGQQ